jgi:nucleoside-diphosphate kinase
MTERTLALIKPDGVSRDLIGDVLKRCEGRGLKVVALKMVRLTLEAAKGFYVVHRERPFYPSLAESMSAGPIVAAVLEGDGAIVKYRELMGATDPKKAAAGTIRADLAVSLEQKTVHGSDSPQSAAFEIPYFFSALDLSRALTPGPCRRRLDTTWWSSGADWRARRSPRFWPSVASRGASRPRPDWGGRYAARRVGGVPVPLGATLAMVRAPQVATPISKRSACR